MKSEEAIDLPTDQISGFHEMSSRLKLLEAALLEREERLRALFEDTFEPVLIVDETGKYMDANTRALQFLECEKADLLKKTVFDFMPPGFSEEQRKESAPFLGQRSLEAQYWVRGKLKTLLLDVIPLRVSGKTIYYGIGQDITERKHDEDALRESELRYRELADALPQAVFELDRRGMVMLTNQAGFQMFGYKEEDFQGGINAFQLLAPEDHKKARENIGLRLARKETLSHEYTILRKDGSRFPALIYASPIMRRGRPVGLRGIVIDITERKRTEESLKESEERLRFLSSKLLSVQEEERSRLAHELHDSIGQVLIGAMYRLEYLQERLGEGRLEGMGKDLSKLIELTQNGVHEIRRICTGLRPFILDDMGLMAGVDWLIDQFRFSSPDVLLKERISVKESDVPEPLKIVLFRTLQEALTNIAKHGEAKSVVVSLSKSGGSLRLMIEDDGAGFDPEKVFSRDPARKGLGLTTMRERTELSGGTFSVKSTEGKGTSIRASWPVKRPSQKRRNSAPQ